MRTAGRFSVWSYVCRTRRHGSFGAHFIAKRATHYWHFRTCHIRQRYLRHHPLCNLLCPWRRLPWTSHSWIAFFTRWQLWQLPPAILALSLTTPRTQSNVRRTIHLWMNITQLSPCRAQSLPICTVCCYLYIYQNCRRFINHTGQQRSLYLATLSLSLGSGSFAILCVHTYISFGWLTRSITYIVRNVAEMM